MSCNFVEPLHLNLFEKITATSSFSLSLPRLLLRSLTCSPSLQLLRPPGLSTAPASELWSEVSGLRAMMPPSGGAAQTGTGHSYQTYQDFSYEEGGQGGQGGGMAAGGGDPMAKLTPLLRSTCNCRATAFMLSLHKALLMHRISLSPILCLFHKFSGHMFGCKLSYTLYG